MTPATRVLVVDDADDLRDSIAEALGQEGYVVSTAGNGQTALDMLRRDRPLPDVILLDLMMPVMDGWTFMVERNKSFELASIPVVICSAQENLEETADSLGASGYLRKPMGLDELLGEVQQVGSAAHCGSASTNAVSTAAAASDSK